MLPFAQQHLIKSYTLSLVNCLMGRLGRFGILFRVGILVKSHLGIFLSFTFFPPYLDLKRDFKNLIQRNDLLSMICAAKKLPFVKALLLYFEPSGGFFNCVLSPFLRKFAFFTVL